MCRGAGDRLAAQSAAPGGLEEDVMKRILIYIFLALQIAGLTGFYAWHANIPDARYLLRTRPVDPRDLLRGEYMILAYEISAPPGGVRGPENGEGATVFGRLKPDERFWI